MTHESNEDLKTMQDEISTEKGKTQDNVNRFNYLLPPTSRPMVMDRRHNKVYPNENKTDVTVDSTGKQVTFSISGGGGMCVDPHTVCITGNLKVNATNAGDRYYNAAGVFGSLARLEVVSFTGESLCDIQSPDVLATILLRGSCPNMYFETVGSEFLMPVRNPVDKRAVTVQTLGIGAAGDQATYNALPNLLNTSENVIPTLKIPNINLNNNNNGAVLQPAAAATETTIYRNMAAVLNLLESYHYPYNYEDTKTKRWFNLAGSAFCLPIWLIIPLFRQDKYIPVESFKKLDIRLTFNQPDQFLTEYVNAGAREAITYTFTNLSLEYQTIRINDAMMFALRKKMMGDGLNFYTRNYWRTSSLIGAGISSATINISRSVGDATALFFVVRTTAYAAGGIGFQANTVANRLQADKLYFEALGTLPVDAAVFLNAAVSSRPQTFRWYVQIGQDRIPSQYIDTVPKELCSVQQAFGKYGDISNQVYSQYDFATGLAVRGLNLEIDPVSQSGMSFTGYSLQNGVQMQLYIEAMDQTDPKQFDIFLEYTETITMTQNKDNVHIVVRQ